jgi:hypothetical protein
LNKRPIGWKGQRAFKPRALSKAGECMANASRMGVEYVTII